MVAPASAVKKILDNCHQLGKLDAICQHVTLVAPIPRYVTSKCCPNARHVHVDNYKSEIVTGIEMHKRLLEGLMLNYFLIYATELVDPVDPILRNRQT
jgi:hypothetical protein